MHLSYELYLLFIVLVILSYIIQRLLIQNKKLKKENHILKQYKQAVEENNIVSIPEHGMVF